MITTTDLYVFSYKVDNSKDFHDTLWKVNSTSNSTYKNHIVAHLNLSKNM